MAVHAPFRFAPIADKVYFPGWGNLVTHDIPFKDGLSGQIVIEIEAMTPLLVGGPRRKAQKAQEGEVWPFQLHDGKYAIPGSSIQGMVRGVLEIAAFGRLGPFVLDRRLGMRDIKSKTGIEFYESRMATKNGGVVTQHAQAGWLIKGHDGPHIVHCEYARIDFGELKLLKGGPSSDPVNILGSRNDAGVRYCWFLGASGSLGALDRTVQLDPRQLYWHANHSVQICCQRAFVAAAAGRNSVAGTIVFTGKPQDGTAAGDKKLEFVFHTPDRRSAAAMTTRFAVSADVWRDFELIHSAQPGREEASPTSSPSGRPSSAPISNSGPPRHDWRFTSAPAVRFTCAP